MLQVLGLVLGFFVCFLALHCLICYLQYGIDYGILAAFYSYERR